MEENTYNPNYPGATRESDKAYEPGYLPTELADDSFYDELSDDEDGSKPHTPDSIQPVTVENSELITQNQSLLSKRPDGISSHRSINNASDEDTEYRVEPLLDVTTPAYAPSQTFHSPSASPTSSCDIEGQSCSPISDEVKPIQTKAEDLQSYVPCVVASTGNSTPESPTAHDGLSGRRNYSFTQPSPSGYGEAFNTATSEDRQPPMTPEIENKRGSNVPPIPLGDDEDEDEDDDGRQIDEFEGFERDDQPKSQLDGIIADIFGESDAEEDFEGFAENELDTAGATAVKATFAGEERTAEVSEESAEGKQQNEGHRRHQADGGEDDNDDDADADEGEEFASDFDKIMERKRDEMRRRRRRNRDIEFLNDSDDLIVALIGRMRNAADEDRRLLAAKQPATKKLRMISEVTKMLRRADLKAALVENGMLSAITEWLSPLPGHTLPNMIIRDSMLTSLAEFQTLSTEVLQESGIGKALMYLYKHPRETRENKARAGRLINEWLRPIFNLTSDYRTLTKEERKQLDYEHLPKRRNIDNENYDHRDINRELDGDAKGLLRPGDPGWVGRARVPQPSNKDYVIRPNWRVSATGEEIRAPSFGDGDDDDEGDEAQQVALERSSMLRRKRRGVGAGGGVHGPTSRIEGHIRQLTSASRQRNAKSSRAMSMSIEGRNM